jgi:hypothetical protein
MMNERQPIISCLLLSFEVPAPITQEKSTTFPLKGHFRHFNLIPATFTLDPGADW